MKAQQRAALNLANELKNKTPTISAALVNAVNNAPPEIVGHAGDGEIKEGDIKNRMSGIDEDLKEAIRNLQKIPERKPSAKRERVLSDEIFGEMIDKKIDDIDKNVNNAVDLSPEILKKASQKQLTTLYNLYNEKTPTSADAVITINQHLDIIEGRLKKMEKQAEAEAELKERAKPRLKRSDSLPGRPQKEPELKRRGSAPGRTQTEPKPTRPKLVRTVTPGKSKVSLEELKPAPKKRGPGRPPGVKNKPKTEEVVEKQFMKDTGKTKRGRPKKKQEGETKPPPIIIERTSEAPTKIEGQGLKDYMNYMKGRKPTKKMKKLIMLIGSQRAGNNSYKLKVEIDKLMADIRQDLTSKISKHKAKSARKQSAEIAKQKRMMQIRQQAKKQMEYERSLAKY